MTAAAESSLSAAEMRNKKLWPKATVRIYCYSVSVTSPKIPVGVTWHYAGLLARASSFSVRLPEINSVADGLFPILNENSTLTAAGPRRT